MGDLGRRARNKEKRFPPEDPFTLFLFLQRSPAQQAQGPRVASSEASSLPSLLPLWLPRASSSAGNRRRSRGYREQRRRMSEWWAPRSGGRRGPRTGESRVAGEGGIKYPQRLCETERPKITDLSGLERRVLVLSPSEIIKTQVPATLLFHLCGLCSHFKISPHSSIVVCVFDNHKWLFQLQSPHSCQWEKETEIRRSPLREPITSHWPELVELVKWLSPAAGESGKCSLHPAKIVISIRKKEPGHWTNIATWTPCTCYGPGMGRCVIHV